MEERAFKAGEIIFREGEESDNAYRILSGKVEIYKRSPAGTVLLAVLSEGEVLGEMGIISDMPRSAYAAAVSDVRVRVISQEYIASLMRTVPEDMALVMRTLMERLRQANQQVTRALSKQHKPTGDAPGKVHPVTQVTLLPLSGLLKQSIPEKGLLISSFPFRVGALPPSMEPNPLDWNNLFVSGADPIVMSRNHFAIQRGANGLQVSDRGSKTGTIVNGVAIGADAPEFKADLHPGDNEIIAGGADSAYRFQLVWE